MKRRHVAQYLSREPLKETVRHTTSHHPSGICPLENCVQDTCYYFYLKKKNMLLD